MFGKIEKNKCLSVVLICVFGLFTCPFYLGAQNGNGTTGILTGHVYFEDGTTPVPRATVKIRKAGLDLTFESSPTDKKGTFRFKDIPPGLYIAGIVYKGDNFNVENAIGIRIDETVDVSLLIGQKRKNPILAFFTSAIGLAIIAAATTGVALAVVTNSGPSLDQEVSAFK